MNAKKIVPCLWFHTENGSLANLIEYYKGLYAIDVARDPLINQGKTDYKVHLFAVGRVGSPVNRMISHDGGNTWVSSDMNGDYKMLFDLKMFDKNIGLVCAASDDDLTKSNAPC